MKHILRNTTILGMATILGLAGCTSMKTHPPPPSMTREQAQRLAEDYAATHGRDLGKYRLVEAESHRKWWFFYDGIEQTVGNHFTVIVNEETGKVGILPGE